MQWQPAVSLAALSLPPEASIQSVGVPHCESQWKRDLGRAHLHSSRRLRLSYKSFLGVTICLWTKSHRSNRTTSRGNVVGNINKFSHSCGVTLPTF